MTRATVWPAPDYLPHQRGAPCVTSVQPLPDYADLGALAGGAPDGDGLAAPWRRGAETAVWFSRGAWAMAAVAAWWRRNHGPGAPGFWLPDYFCNASTAPLRQVGIDPQFYPITEALAPDWPRLRAMAGTRPCDLFVLVHYFGRPAAAPEARAFCDETGALLIEDAAHALGPAGDIGSHGDFVFYSPHKVLAVPHGALLLINTDADGAQFSPAPGTPSPWPWLAKRLVQASLPAAARRALVRRRTPAFSHDPAYAPMPDLPAPHPAALKLIARAAPRLAAVGGARQANARALGEAWSGRPGITVLAGDGAAAPYRLVLRADDAPGIHERLRRAGCPVETWPDLAPEVVADPDTHAAALGLRRSLVLLPVHQSLSPVSLAACCS